MSQNNMRKKPKEIKWLNVWLPIYRISVVVSMGGTVEEIVRWGIQHKVEKTQFTERWKDWIKKQMEEKTTKGFCCDYGDDNKDVLIWVRKRPQFLSDYRILYHEIYHAVDHIANSRNFNVEDKMSEPKAYLFEYLLSEISNPLWNISKSGSKKRL